MAPEESTQESPLVQALRSSHEVPGVEGSPTHCPAPSHRSELVQEFESSQAVPWGCTAPRHCPCTQESERVQGFPSSHVAPSMTTMLRQPSAANSLQESAVQGFPSSQLLGS